MMNKMFWYILAGYSAVKSINTHRVYLPTTNSLLVNELTASKLASYLSND